MDLCWSNSSDNGCVSVTHVQMETPACCCHGCYSRSHLVLEQESFGFVKKGYHESAELWSGSPLQRKQKCILLCCIVTLILLCFQQCLKGYKCYFTQVNGFSFFLSFSGITHSLVATTLGWTKERPDDIFCIILSTLEQNFDVLFDALSVA